MTEAEIAKMQEELRDMAAMAAEPLCEALEPYAERGEMGLTIRHPLVHGPMIIPGLANRSLKWKMERLKEAVTSGDWSAYVWTHERPYRVQILAQILRELDHAGTPMPLAARGKLTAGVWTDSENLHEVDDDDLAMICYAGWGKPYLRWHHMMDSKEQETLMHAIARGQETENGIKVYRGCIEGLNERGWSWTLDEEKAKWFAVRFASIAEARGQGGDPVVLCGYIEPWCTDNIVAYLNHRSEHEIVIRPDNVGVRKRENVRVVTRRAVDDA